MGKLIIIACVYMQSGRGAGAQELRQLSGVAGSARSRAAEGKRARGYLEQERFLTELSVLSGGTSDRHK